MRPIPHRRRTEGSVGRRALYAGRRARERREKERDDEAWIAAQEF